MCVSLHSLGRLWSKLSLSLRALLMFFRFTGPKKQVEAPQGWPQVSGVREPGCLILPTSPRKVTLFDGPGSRAPSPRGLWFPSRLHAENVSANTPCALVFKAGSSPLPPGRKGLFWVIVLSVPRFVSMFQEKEKLQKLSSLCFPCKILHNFYCRPFPGCLPRVAEKGRGLVRPPSML